VAEALVEPRLGPGVASLAGALGFGIGVVFLVVGRSELFTQNFFDPVAAAIGEQGRRLVAGACPAAVGTTHAKTTSYPGAPRPTVAVP
jgi:hypothetical protein